jgi:hypothetical protein
MQPESGEILTSRKAHSKYVVRVLWAKCSDAELDSATDMLLVTASQDQSVGVYYWEGAVSESPALNESTERGREGAQTLEEIKKVDVAGPTDTAGPDS